MMGKKCAVVLLAEGAEEIEFITPIDLLRRAGVDVTVASVAGSNPVKGGHDILVCPDVSLEEVADKEFDVVIIPGGMGGVRNLSESPTVKKLLEKQENRGGCIAAICAGPLVLKKHGIALNKTITSYPSVKKDLESNFTYVDDSVVVDDTIITSRGPGTAMEFALTIIEKLVGNDARNKISSGIIYSH